MDIEPLDARLWFEALERLAHRLESEPVSALERQLRHAFHLRQLAPRPLRTLLRATCGEDEYEATLERGDYAGAAEALVGPPLTHSVHRFGNEKVEVAVFLPGNPIPVSFSSETFPSALLGAWLRSLQTLKAFVRVPANEVRDPAAAVFQTGSRAQLVH